MSNQTPRQVLNDGVADALARDPRVLQVLEDVCGEAGESPLIELWCKGAGRTNHRHRTGAVLRFKRYGDGWTLAGTWSTLASPSVDTDGHVTVAVPCKQCSTSRVLAGREALRRLLEALVIWRKAQDGDGADDTAPPRRARAVWY